MTSRISALLLTITLAGCSLPLAPSDDVRRTARLGQAVRMGLVTVRPIRVIEDSRCPAAVQCVQTGALRVSVEIAPPSGSRERTLTLGEPHRVAGGSLVLEDALPRRQADAPIPPEAYAFRFSYLMPAPR